MMMMTILIIIFHIIVDDKIFLLNLNFYTFYFQVYNSSHSSERNLVAELSGNVIPARFHSEKEFLIIFESDGNVNRPGWAAAISYG